MKVSKAIKVLSQEGFELMESSAHLVRLGRNGNWIEIERDGSSYMAYNLSGNEYAYTVVPHQLNCAVQVALDLF